MTLEYKNTPEKSVVDSATTSLAWEDMRLVWTFQKGRQQSSVALVEAYEH
jgi:hypothetical protein